MAKSIKTNAARILDKNKLSYNLLTYRTDGSHKNGEFIADTLNRNIDTIFKTLVTQGATKNYYVFVIPVMAELDLKKAAASVGEKNVELIPVKKILETTGYIRGGCSPIGMKKQFITVFDISALKFPQIIVSAGKIGFHIEIAPLNLIELIGANVADILR